MITIIGPTGSFQPTLENGSLNPVWAFVSTAGAVQSQGAQSYLTLSDPKGLTLPVLTDFVAMDCRVEGYPCWFVVPDLEVLVPDILDVRSSTDIDGNPVADTPLKWSQWMVANRVVTKIDGTNYVPSNGSGSPLPGEVVIALIGLGFDVKTLPEMQELVAAIPPSDPI